MDLHRRSICNSAYIEGITLLVYERKLNLAFYVHYTFLINTLRMGDANLRFYITTAQDGWRKSAFLTCACFPCTIHLIMQYMEPVSEWSC